MSNTLSRRGKSDLQSGASSRCKVEPLILELVFENNTIIPERSAFVAQVHKEVNTSEVT